jgi:hypothetical protein
MGRTLAEHIAMVATMDSKNAVKGMKDLAGETQKSLGDSEKGIDAWGKKATLAGAAMVAAGAAGGAALVGMGQKAIKLEDSIRGTNRVFGEAEAIITQYAENSAESLGLSEQAFRDSTSVLGSMITSMGWTEEAGAKLSIQMHEVGADLGSAFGTSTQEAITAIAALLRGERDPIERFGVSIKQVDINARTAALGLDVSTAAAKKYSESVVAVDLLMEQAAKHQDAFAENAGSAMKTAQAHWEDAQAALGEQMIPVLTGVAEGASGAMKAFQSVDEASGGLASSVAVAGTGVLLLGGGLLAAAGQAIKFREALASNAKLATMAKGIGAVGAAVTVAYLAWDTYNQKQAEADRRVADVTATLEAEGDVVAGLHTVISQHVSDQTVLGKAVASSGVLIDELVAAAEGSQDELQAMFDILSQNVPSMDVVPLMKELEPLRKAAADVRLGQEELAKALGETGDGAAEAGSSLRAVEQDKSNLIDITLDLVGSIQDHVAALAEEAAAVKALQAAAENQISTVFAVDDAERALHDSTIALSEAEGDLTDVHSEASKAAQDVVEDMIALSQANFEADKATVGADKALDNQISSLREMGQYFPELQGLLDIYIATLVREDGKEYSNTFTTNYVSVFTEVQVGGRRTAIGVEADTNPGYEPGDQDELPRNLDGTINEEELAAIEGPIGVIGGNVGRPGKRLPSTGGRRRRKPRTGVRPIGTGIGGITGGVGTPIVPVSQGPLSGKSSNVYLEGTVFSVDTIARGLEELSRNSELDLTIRSVISR